MSLRAVSFDCRGAALCGIVTDAEEQGADVGVLVVTGGPQYRVGSHRQFVQLSRHLSHSGFASMRFDHRGSGDSAGDPPNFDALDDDIAAAVDCFIATAPDVRRVVIWGLCDAASAALLYAGRDPRVAGLVLLNPWVRREKSQAQTQLKSWYRARLAEREFWRRLFSGEVLLWQSLKGFAQSLFAAGRSRRGDEADFVDRMLAGAQRFDRPVLVVLSGEDLTAQEFAHVADSDSWRDWYNGDHVTRVEIPRANHTFSRRDWKDSVAGATVRWLDVSVCGTRPAGSSPDTPSR